MKFIDQYTNNYKRFEVEHEINTPKKEQYIVTDEVIE